MNTLVGVDTAKVYHQFDFISDQVKDLKCEQWFIHTDLLNWMEEELNRRTDWNAIKIMYKQIYHFDLNHVKCLEIYYENRFDYQMTTFIDSTQYKMPWKGETVYYTKSDPERHDQRVDIQLQTAKLQKYLTKTYEMKVDWKFERCLTVYEFHRNINNDQKLKLDKLFQEINLRCHSVFISRIFLFLNATEPPTIMETEALLPFHGQFLSDLSIQDILAVELANKDHRLPFYDRDLDHDIQMHLQTRWPKFYEGKRIKTYVLNDFTNSTILKYFVYKYLHCFNEILIPQQILNSIGHDLIMYENQKLKLIILQNNHLHVDVMSSRNTTVCSLAYTASRTALTHHSPQLVAALSTKYIHLDDDMNFTSNDLSNFEIQIQSVSGSFDFIYFEILIRTDNPPATVFVLIHKLFEQIGNLPFQRNITVRLSAMNSYSYNSIPNIFLNVPSEFNMEFKNITFHLHRIMKWLSENENDNSVSFIDCRILLNRGRAKLRKIAEMQNTNIISSIKVLTYKDMDIDVHLPIRCRTVVFDNCHIIPSVWTALSSATFDTVYFKNMTIRLDTVAPWQYESIEFKNCQILESSEIVDFYPTNPDHYFKITFENMNIEMSTLFQILCKFDDVTFKSCRLLCTDNFIPKTSIKLDELRFNLMPVTPELTNILKYFVVKSAIQFQYCEITNETLLKIWNIKRDQRFTITGTHQINGNFYFELTALLYENRLDQLHLQFRDGIRFPFENFINIEWQHTRFLHMNLREIRIRSVLVNDATMKLEYLRNGLVVDLHFEQNEWHDSDICDVDYF